MDPSFGKSGRLRTALWHLALALVASALLAAIVAIVRLTDQAQKISQQKGQLDGILTADVSTTLTLVRTLQGLLTISVTVLLSQCFTYIQWGFARHASGASYIRQLALSPTTTLWGTIRLMAHGSSAFWPRVWALSR
jgi:hypothetical protein